MTESAEVYLWGSRIGVVSLGGGGAAAAFRYDSAFIGAGIEPSPLTMPVSAQTYAFPDLRPETFHGLPGLLADSLPDKFGSAVLDAWLLAQGRSLESLSPIERLCYLGSRGMGALEYRPALCGEDDSCEVVHVDALAALAAEILKERESRRASLLAGMKEYGQILKVGASAGGARAKAIIGWNEETSEVRSGQVRLPEGFGYWLMKFDALKGNGDKDGDDPKGYGRVEYAYSLMAKKAGIEMSECRLWDGVHFMTRRFDRAANGRKLHMQTLGALAHFDFNAPRQHSYEQAFRVTRAIVNDVRALRELYRRMVFNVLAWNCDDHVKNISYLMERDGQWHLAPAYDLTFAYNPQNRWLCAHQMSVAAKNAGIDTEDLLAAAKVAGIEKSVAKVIIEEVADAVAAWQYFAQIANVPESLMESIARQLANRCR